MKNVLLFLLLSTFITAQTVYVNSATGNDATGNGTSGSPYKTFSKGYSMVSSGGTLYLSGTFTWSDADETGDGASHFTIDKNITIQGPNNGLAVIQSSTSLTASKRIFYIGSSDADYVVTLKNLELRYGWPNTGDSGNDGGALIQVRGSLTIQNCYIHSNKARQGCGLNKHAGNLTIENSTIANNVSTQSQTGLAGGGINFQGGGTVIITNSTIYNNTGVTWGGGMYINNGPTVIITNSTITNNSVLDIGGGIGVETGTLYIKNNIIANNSDASNGADIDHFAGTIISNGYNIIEVENSGSIPEIGDITGNQANLFGTGIGNTPALALNNSYNYTPTLKTVSGSVAINTGNSTNNNSVSVPLSDQRGAERNETVDIGAYEYWNDEGILPVELNSFNASISGKNILLNWQTETETNNYGFEIERSTLVETGHALSHPNPTSQSWDVIGFVAGSGNSNSSKDYAFTDKNINSGKYQYRLKQIDNDGEFNYSKVIEVEIGNTPSDYSLSQNYPNPFNPSTTIRFGLPENSKVVLDIYNLVGEKVATLINGDMEAGYHDYQFSVNAYRLSSGIYFYKLSAGNFTATKKLILMK